MDIIQMVAIFYNGPEGLNSTVDRRLETYRNIYQRVVSKDPFRAIEKRVFIEEGVYIIKNPDSITGHCSETGIKFTFTPGETVRDLIAWKMDIDKLIKALLPELQCHNVLVAETKVEIYRI